MIRLLLASALLLCASFSWGETPLFKTFFEQRELVTSVLFEKGSSKLTDMAARELGSMLPRIREAGCEARLIRIEGFSGKEGTAEYNFRLSMNRANSVAQFLEKKGVPCLVGVNGYGDLRVGQNDATSEPRVEIAAYPKMFIFDFDSARQVAIQGVKMP
jgi:outer membrane protein OmpA-like peptidoglycan-associated protein